MTPAGAVRSIVEIAELMRVFQEDPTELRLLALRMRARLAQLEEAQVDGSVVTR